MTFYRPDETFGVDAMLIADLDPIGTGYEYLRLQHDDYQAFALATHEAFGEPLAPVRDSHGRIARFASTLKDLNTARRGLRTG